MLIVPPSVKCGCADSSLRGDLLHRNVAKPLLLQETKSRVQNGSSSLLTARPPSISASGVGTATRIRLQEFLSEKSESKSMNSLSDRAESDRNENRLFVIAVSPQAPPE